MPPNEATTGSATETADTSLTALADVAHGAAREESARRSAEAKAEAERLAAEAARVTAEAEAQLKAEVARATEDAEAEAERIAATEGLKLVPSNTTGGYRGVKKDKNLSSRPYYAQVKQNGKCKSLGYFATAKEAALAYARAKGIKTIAEAGVPEEGTEESEVDRLASVEGLTLIPAPDIPSGYKGVKFHKDKRHKRRPYEARTTVGGRTQCANEPRLTRMTR